MDITSGALRRIIQLKNRGGLPAGVALRLGFRGKNICLQWERGRPQENDLVIRNRGVVMVIDAQTYVRVGGYMLDLDGDIRSRRFVLRPKGRRRERPRNFDGAADSRSFGGLKQ